MINLGFSKIELAVCALLCSFLFASSASAVAVYDLERDYSSLNARFDILMDPNLEEFVFSTHILKLDHGGMIFLALLKMAADRGVKVVGVTDRGIGGATNQIYSYLAGLGLDIRIYNPIKVSNFLFKNPLHAFELSNRRIHDKAWVAKIKKMKADGTQESKFFALAGDKNISSKYFSMARVLLPSQTTMNGRETVIEDSTLTREIYSHFKNLILNDPLVVKTNQRPDRWVAKGFAAELAKYEDWLENRRNKRSLEVTAKQWQRVSFEIPEENIKFLKDEHIDGKKISTYRQVLEILRAAPKGEDVLIENPYFVLEPELIETIGILKRNGNRVVLLTNMPEYTDVSFIKQSFRADMEKVASLGIDVYFIAYPNKITHAKMAVIGNRLVYRGSANFDPRSLNLNSESGEIYDSKDLAEYYRKRFWTRVMTSTVVGISSGKIFYDKEFAEFRKREQMVQKMTSILSLGLVKRVSRDYTSFLHRSNIPNIECKLFYNDGTGSPKVSIFKRLMVDLMRAYL